MGDQLLSRALEGQLITARLPWAATVGAVIALAGCHADTRSPGPPPPPSIDNPFPVQALHTMSGRFRLPDGTLKIGFDPGDVVRTPIALRAGSALPPGAYDLYVQVGEDARPPGLRRIEIGLADCLRLLTFQAAGGPHWVGPIHFETRLPAVDVEMRGDAELALSRLWLAPAGQPPPTVLEPVSPDPTPGPWTTLWLDLPLRTEIPAWFTPEMAVEVRVRSYASSPGTARVTCQVLDYDHVEVARHDFRVSVGPCAGEGREPVPVPRTFGPYLLRCSVLLADHRSLEFQHVVARIRAPLELHADLLGGHGTASLLPRMGAGWNRLWDSGGSAASNATPHTLGVLDPSSNRESLPWLEFVVRTVRHTRGIVSAWEIYNEPYRPPQEPWVSQHVAAVAATAAAIREQDPRALVVSGGPPEEVDPEHVWWTTLVKARLFDAVDVIAAHMYGGGGGLAPLDIDVAFDRFADDLRQLLDANGARGKPLWDTESGIGPNESFYVARHVDYGYWDATGFHVHPPVPYRVGTAMTARLLLLHLWHGIRWFPYQGATSYGNSYAMVDFDGTPLPMTVVVAQLVRLLNHAKPAGRPATPPGMLGVEFRTRERSIAALWSIGRSVDDHRPIVLAAPAGVTALDMFANPIALDHLQIGIEPVLLVGPHRLVEETLTTLRVRDL